MRLALIYFLTDFYLEHTPEKITNKSRQFDLFSLIFGDEFDNQTATDNEQITNQQSTQNPVRTSTSNHLPPNSSTGDSIFAAIEAGLKYIEKNDDTVGSLLDSHAKITANKTYPIPATSSERPIVVSTTSELSFLDILLGDDDEDEDVPVDSNGSSLATKMPDEQNQPATADFNLEQRTTIAGSTISAEDSHLPLTLERTDQPNTVDSMDNTSIGTTDESATTQDLSNIDYSTNRIDSTTYVDESESVTETDFTSTSNVYSTTEDLELSSKLDNILSTSNFEVETQTPTEYIMKTPFAALETTHVPTEGLTNTTSKIPVKDLNQIVQNITESPIASSTNSFAQDLQELLSHSSHLKPNRTASFRPKRPQRPQLRVPTTFSPSPNVSIKATTENIFSALFGGISNIFSQTNETSGNTNRYKIRVNNQTNGSFNRSTNSPLKRSTTTEEPQLPVESRNETLLPENTMPLSTAAPIVVNSNPSILESDMNYDYGDPTLPPSLPNLNIIPFLPTDAVKTNRNHGSFGFVRTNSTPFQTLPDQHDFDPTFTVQTYPKSANPSGEVILAKESKSTSDHNDFQLFQVGAKLTGNSADSIYHHQAEQDDGYNKHSYPSITEPNFDEHDNNDAPFSSFSKYGSNEYHEYAPYQTAEHRINDYDTIKTSSGHDESSYGIVTSYEPFGNGGYLQDKVDEVEYKTSNPLFGGISKNKFSPPSETEGNFYK